ncbi:hypothetical protein XTALMG727_0959 [Xanthomonas translucens pv. arrhenatheri LMG 727]|uniref:Uncharacterized protein n=1 Tax=Xanthomonas graminis pv. arrhenatheri LMG 727 TaxID=1195923 RepID=A0A0K2ZJB6_9XANT|nr:hypothetical protein XTALMG727_0959 [Xanthomonas translucens pv. arrhenatheri LMG 727]
MTSLSMGKDACLFSIHGKYLERLNKRDAQLSGRPGTRRRDSEAALPYANSAADLSAKRTGARNGRMAPVTPMLGAQRRVFLANPPCARSAASLRAGSRVLPGHRVVAANGMLARPQPAAAHGPTRCLWCSKRVRAGRGVCERVAAARLAAARGRIRRTRRPAGAARRRHRAARCGHKKTRKTDVFQVSCDLETGRGDRIRTCDLYVPNVALYQTELHPEGAAHDTGVARIRQDPLRKNFSRRRPGRRPRGPRTTCR